MANVLMASIVIPVNVLEDLWEMTAKQVNHVLLLNAIVVVPVLVVVLVVVVDVVAVVVVAIEDVLHFLLFPSLFSLHLLFHLVSEINECDSQPCKNGGKCVDEHPGSGSGSGSGSGLVDLPDNFYSCVCPRGYTGKNCEIGKIYFPNKTFLSWN